MPDQQAVELQEMERALRVAEGELATALRTRDRDQVIIDRQFAHLKELQRRFAAWESRIVNLRAKVARLKLEQLSRRRPVPLGELQRLAGAAFGVAP
jgi:hypothetical protein